MIRVVLFVLLAATAMAMGTGCKRANRRGDAAPATRTGTATDEPEAGPPALDAAVVEPEASGGADDAGPAEPETESPTSDAEEQPDLPGLVTVHRLVTCREVRGGRAVRVSQTFRRQQGVRFYAFVEAETVGPDDQTITVTLQSSDSVDDATRPAKLRILAGRSYRTSTSFATWRPPGDYEVVVRDDAGTVVARASLRVVD
ncbi:MAG: hypothetical protein HY905_19830 [Deltaproteobacteria bacterium]|nr:hypothetical protein [Deltaproteobacteria bacterium]